MLKQRVLTAVVLLLVMGGMLFFAPDSVWAGFCALIAGLVLWEYSRLFAISRVQRGLFLAASFALLAGLCWQSPHLPGNIAASGNFFLTAGALAVLLFWLVFVPFCLVRGVGVRSFAAIWAAGWILVVPFWLALVDLRLTFGAQKLFLLMALVWVADIGAYFVGKKFGRHKLAPAISPGKSWEGAAGGLASVLLYVYLLVPLLLGHGLGGLPLLLALLPLLCVLTAISIAGDLWESCLKRRAGVKDSSSLLPGHGGVFDRSDALIAVLSVAYAAVLLAARFLH